MQGEKFRSLMDRLLKLKEQGYSITAVTVWGLADDMICHGGKEMTGRMRVLYYVAISSYINQHIMIWL